MKLARIATYREEYREEKGNCQSTILRKKVTSAFFVALLVSCTVLGAIPITVQTPAGVVSTDALEAQARNRNTSANRPRSVSVRNTGARLHERFTANRINYRVELRQATARADIRVGISAGQQTRWRIDTRNVRGNWVNGSYNSWSNRATRNANRNVRVRVEQGQERRLRLQIRDRRENVRTLTFTVQRASGNTWGANLRSNVGVFSQDFERAARNYRLVIPSTRTAATRVSMRPAQERAMIRHRMRIQCVEGMWGEWGSWSTYARGQQARSVGTIPRGKSAEVQFDIRGAWTSRNNTPLRNRIYTVTVIRPYATVERLRLDRTSELLTVGERASIGVTQLLPYTVPHNTIRWSSNNTGVVTVDGNGRVRAWRNGRARVTAETVCGARANVNITVRAFHYVRVTNLNFRGQLERRSSTRGIVLHHTVGDINVRQIHNFHRSIGMRGIAYHFLIDRQGRVWQGRPIDVAGSHIRYCLNNTTIGIAWRGNFENVHMTPAAKEAGERLIRDLLYKYPEIRWIHGHGSLRTRIDSRQSATACPGRNFPTQHFRNLLRNR